MLELPCAIEQAQSHAADHLEENPISSRPGPWPWNSTGNNYQVICGWIGALWIPCPMFDSTPSHCRWSLPAMTSELGQFGGWGFDADMIFSPVSIIQYVGLYVFSLPISLVKIERIYILCLTIIINLEVWTITHCLGLGYETLVSAVCLSIFLWGLCCQKQVSQAGISNYIPQFTVGCNYLSLPEIPASGNQVLIYQWLSAWL